MELPAGPAGQDAPAQPPLVKVQVAPEWEHAAPAIEPPDGEKPEAHVGVAQEVVGTVSPMQRVPGGGVHRGARGDGLPNENCWASEALSHVARTRAAPSAVDPEETATHLPD